ncbi:hypothetical protein [Absidia glauca]|uniref:Uncharacterized protein n=1 Tax=Absidia glauca TaxID=4829 RepID=A0A168NDY5_ABSGL|nr:hypothetical protein [Absidia glauca]
MDSDMDLMEEILARVDWKRGIRPLGNLATEICFVQKEMPLIKCLVGNLSTSMLVTQSSWTSNLIDTGVLSNLTNDTTMHSLSDLHLLFHTRQQQPGHRTLHHLRLDSQAYFSVNHVLRPTIKFQRALDAALSHLHVDNERAWQELCKVWHDFGYLWPQKIILGHRHHVKHSYQVRSDSERVQQLQVARDHTSALLDIELRKSQRSSLGTSHDDYHIIGHHQEPIRDTDYWRQITSSWKVIKRDDVRPIYEFLPTPMRDSIHHLITIFVHRIPINQPFMLRSVSTNGYLSWRLNPKQQNTNGHQQHSGDISTALHSSTLQSVSANHHSYIQQKAAPVIFSTLPLGGMKATNSLCVWQFSDKDKTIDLESPLLRETRLSTTPAPIKYVRCGSQLYLTPCIPPNTQNSGIVLTSSNSSPSSGAESSTGRRGWDLYVEKAARVRSLEFFDTHQLSEDGSAQHQWTVESPDLGLDLDDDFSTDGHLNVDIAIGRRKPILDQEIISLRQILYLCSVYNQIPRTPSTQQTKRRPTNNTSQSPPIVIPSPVPPAAAGVMAMFRKSTSNDDDDKRAFSNPSTSLGNSHHKRNRNRTTIAATTSTAPLLLPPPPPSSSATKALSSNPASTHSSISTLPYYNLHTYTVLPAPLVSSSCLTTPLSPGFPSPHPSSLPASPYQHYMNPVLAKEHSLINGPEESYWVIELLSKGENKRRQTLASGDSTAFGSPSKERLLTGPSVQFRATPAGIENIRPDTTPLRLKMVVSSETLRSNAREETSNHTLRRTQSFSSVHDLQQPSLGMVPGITNGRNRYHVDHSKHNSNDDNDTADETAQIPPASPMAALSPSLSAPLQQCIIPDGLFQAKATDNIQPYLQLYVAKQNSKTWSHFIKHSSLANIKRWLKTT